MPYCVVLYSVDNCNLAWQTVELKKMKIPSNNFKDAVDRPLQPTFLQNCEYDFFLSIFFGKRMYFWGAMQKPRKWSRPKSFCRFWEGMIYPDVVMNIANNNDPIDWIDCRWKNKADNIGPRKKCSWESMLDLSQLILIDFDEIWYRVFNYQYVITVRNSSKNT